MVVTELWLQAPGLKSLDVNQYVAINIALLIDILMVTAGAGMIASLSFAEWQRALGRGVGLPLVAPLPANESRLAGEGQSLTMPFFLLSLSLFSLALFFGGWHGSIPMAEWSVVMLAVLSALSITQTLFVVRNRQRTRLSAQRNSTNEGG